VLLSLVAAAALVGILLVVLLMQPAAPLSVAGLGAVVAVALGIVTTDALLQETTTNAPLPAARARRVRPPTGPCSRSGSAVPSRSRSISSGS
jgi:Na+-transporting NADH:ubiquinone oxidoreductase subunit NqrB